MTRPRSRAPGPAVPVYRRSRLLLPFLLATVMSACIGSNAPAAAPPSSAAAATASVPTSAPSTASAALSSTPASLAPETAAPTPTATPTAATSPSASPSGGAASVEGCAGNDDNRTFWASAAKAMSWPVYCPSLPARWVVVHGSYKGQTLDITYRGPGGVTLELHEGAFCANSDGCVPEGVDGGIAVFGDMAATFVNLVDGRAAVVAGRGEHLSWLAIGDGLGDDEFATLTDALIRLD